MSSSVVVVDYGIGNVSSVLRAVSQFTKNCELSADHKKISSADRLILPGDGAFGDSMTQLRKRQLLEPIINYIRRGNKFLGICVGMQLLFSTSSEFGNHRGMNIIPGSVVGFPSSKTKIRYKIPQIGWNKLLKPKTLKNWKGTIFEDISDGDWVYFLHSYIVVPEDDRYNLSLTDYGGILYSSAIMKDNISACQFHPEKSGTVGLKILKRFIL